MKKIIIILCFILVSCGSTKQVNNQDNYKTDEKVLNGLLFGIITYAILSAISVRN
mgnify:FL=1|tara:strand:+ start:495 stop:659 length:165 start_codon:yes stop_codon:yes gene_type:complete